VGLAEQAREKTEKTSNRLDGYKLPSIQRRHRVKTKIQGNAWARLAANLAVERGQFPAVGALL
jgi:hypothetical protein